MPADVLTNGKERVHVELMRKLLLLGNKSVLPPRCWRKEDDKLVNASYGDTKNADEKHVRVVFNTFFGCAKMRLDSRNTATLL